MRNEDDKTPVFKTVTIQSEMKHPNNSGVSSRSSSAINKRKKARLTSIVAAPSIVSKESLDKRARNEDFLKKRPTDTVSERAIAIPTRIQNKSALLRDRDNLFFQVIPSSNLISENNVYEKQKEVSGALNIIKSKELLTHLSSVSQVLKMH